MTRTGRRAIAIFVLMMLGMSVVGTVNQGRLQLQDELITLKEALIVERGALRARAERVRGPHAVSSWARSHGMIPALENDSVVQVAPVAGPSLQGVPSGLEVATRWR